MYIVYILQSKKDLRTYTGYTKNLNQRLIEHNNGKVLATKNRKPFELLYSEKFGTKTEAKYREQYWKSGAGRKNLQRIYGGFPPRFRKRGEARSN
jgi:putative endonuclease